MSEHDPKLVELNTKNRNFWEMQRERRNTLIRDAAVVHTAMEIAEFDASSRLFRYWHSFEEALELARREHKCFKHHTAVAGGKSARADLLQQLIVNIVRAKPEISNLELLQGLKNQERGLVIDEIDEKFIYFRRQIGSGRGRKRSENGDHGRVISDRAPISGLKHRLTRARKKILANTPSR